MKSFATAMASATALVLVTTLAVAQAMTEGEVRKIDTAQNKITLKHEAIKNLDMPPMSMVFDMKDPAQLADFKAGDKVRFTADKLNGRYTVTAIERVR